MDYPKPVQLDELPPYIQGRLQELKYGQKGELAKKLGVPLTQVSHFITGTRPVPQKYIPGILEFFGERVNLQIIRLDTEEVVKS